MLCPQSTFASSAGRPCTCVSSGILKICRRKGALPRYPRSEVLQLMRASFLPEFTASAHQARKISTTSIKPRTASNPRNRCDGVQASRHHPRHKVSRRATLPATRRARSRLRLAQRDPTHAAPLRGHLGQRRCKILATSRMVSVQIARSVRRSNGERAQSFPRLHHLLAAHKRKPPPRSGAR